MILGVIGVITVDHRFKQVFGHLVPKVNVIITWHVVVSASYVVQVITLEAVFDHPADDHITSAKTYKRVEHIMQTKVIAFFVNKKQHHYKVDTILCEDHRDTNKNPTIRPLIHKVLYTPRYKEDTRFQANLLTYTKCLKHSINNIQKRVLVQSPITTVLKPRVRVQHHSTKVKPKLAYSPSLAFDYITILNRTK